MSFLSPPPDPRSSQYLPSTHTTHQQPDPYSHPHAQPYPLPLPLPPPHPHRPSINPIHPDYRPTRGDPSDIPPPGSAMTSHSNYSYSLYTVPASEVSVNRRWLDRMKGWAEDVEESEGYDEGDGVDVWRETRKGQGGRSLAEKGGSGHLRRDEGSTTGRRHDRGSTLLARPPLDGSFPTPGFAHHPTIGPLPAQGNMREVRHSSSFRRPGPQPPSSFAEPFIREGPVRSNTDRQSTILPFESISSRPTPTRKTKALPLLREDAQAGIIRAVDVRGHEHARPMGQQEMRIGSMTFTVADSDAGAGRSRAKVGTTGAKAQSNGMEDPQSRLENTPAGDRIANRRLTAYHPESEAISNDASDRLSMLSIDDRTRHATAMNAGSNTKRTTVPATSATTLRHQTSIPKRFTPFPSAIPADLKALPPVPASTTASWTSPADYVPSREAGNGFSSIATMQTARKGVRRPGESTIGAGGDAETQWKPPRVGTPWNSRPATPARTSGAEYKTEDGWEDMVTETGLDLEAPSIQRLRGNPRNSGIATSRRSSHIDEADTKADSILTHAGEARPRKRYPDRAVSKVMSMAPTQAETRRSKPEVGTIGESVEPWPTARSVKSMAKTRKQPTTVSAKQWQLPDRKVDVISGASPSLAVVSVALPEPTMKRAEVHTNGEARPSTGSGRPLASHMAKSSTTARTPAASLSAMSRAARPSLENGSLLPGGPSTERGSEICRTPTQQRSGMSMISAERTRGSERIIRTMSAAPPAGLKLLSARVEHAAGATTAGMKQSRITDHIGGDREQPFQQYTRGSNRSFASAEQSSHIAPERPQSTATWITIPSTPTAVPRPNSGGCPPRSPLAVFSDAFQRDLTPGMGSAEAFRRPEPSLARTGMPPPHPGGVGRQSDPLPRGVGQELPLSYPPFAPAMGPTFHPSMMLPFGPQPAYIPIGPLLLRTGRPGLGVGIPLAHPQVRTGMVMAPALGRGRNTGSDPLAPGMLRQRSQSDPYFSRSANRAILHPKRGSSRAGYDMAMSRIRSGPTLMPQRQISMRTPRAARQTQRAQGQTRLRVPQRQGRKGVPSALGHRQIAADAAERALRKQERARIRAARLLTAEVAARTRVGGVGQLVIPVSVPPGPSRRAGPDKGKGRLKGLFGRK